MDIFERDGGATTADTVHKREEFRQIVADVHELPETQRTALLLREIDALSYDQIAEAMDTTVPSVKSLLVRARVSLAEAAESRLLTCGEVRVELGQVAEGLARTTAPVRRHLKVCDRCRTFSGELRKTTRALAAVYPIGPLVLPQEAVGGEGRRRRRRCRRSRRVGRRAAGGGGVAGVAATAAGGLTAGGAVSAGVSTLASKAAAGMAAAVIVTAGAVEVKHVSERQARAPGAGGRRPRAETGARRAAGGAAGAGSRWFTSPRRGRADGRARGSRARARRRAGSRPRPWRRRRPTGAGGRLDGHAAAPRGAASVTPPRRPASRATRPQRRAIPPRSRLPRHPPHRPASPAEPASHRRPRRPRRRLRSGLGGRAPLARPLGRRTTPLNETPGD